MGSFWISEHHLVTENVFEIEFDIYIYFLYIQHIEIWINGRHFIAGIFKCISLNEIV